MWNDKSVIKLLPVSSCYFYIFEIDMDQGIFILDLLYHHKGTWIGSYANKKQSHAFDDFSDKSQPAFETKQKNS